MAGLPPLGLPPAFVAEAGPPDAAALARRGEARKAARDFEAAFLASMLKPMFESVETSAPFGGGHGEAMFKSFLTEAMAKQMARAGGVGVADVVAREMLRLQEHD